MDNHRITVTSEECRRLKELEEILRRAANEYTRATDSAIREKEDIIRDRINRNKRERRKARNEEALRV